MLKRINLFGLALTLASCQIQANQDYRNLGLAAAVGFGICTTAILSYRAASYCTDKANRKPHHNISHLLDSDKRKILAIIPPDNKYLAKKAFYTTGKYLSAVAGVASITMLSLSAANYGLEDKKLLCSYLIGAAIPASGIYHSLMKKKLNHK